MSTGRDPWSCDRLLWSTLCLTLVIATAGIVGLMFAGHNVAKEVSLAVAAQWAGLLAVAAKRKGAR